MENNNHIIESFSGPYRWLSNFWPVKINYDGIIYPSVEHAYQAAKTTNKKLREEIAQLPSPSEAKKYWDTHPLKSKTPNWKNLKISIMATLIKEKFSISNEIMLVRLLVETAEKRIIEGNNWGDDFWGKVKKDGQKWRGKNHLGSILTSRRTSFLVIRKLLNDRMGINPSISNKNLANSYDLSERDLYLYKMAFSIK
jgi:ribA/ribD-fused uncharacterized protein